MTPFERAMHTRDFLLPCPICNGIEGCDHSLPERAMAESERRKRPSPPPQPEAER